MSKISELSDGGSLISSDYLIAVRSGGNVKVRMNQIDVDQVDLGDNEFIRLGNSQDLTMVHTSTQSIINQAGIGDLLLQKAGTTKASITANGLEFPDNSKAIFGAGSDLQIYHDGNNSRIVDAGTGYLKIQATDRVAIRSADDSEKMADFYANADVKLYYDNAQKFSTTSTGIDVTGTATMDGLTVDGVGRFNNNSNENLFLADTLSATRSSLQISGVINYFNANIDSASHGIFAWRSSSAYTERMRIDSAGNVGIGTSSPTAITNYTTVAVNGTTGGLIDFENGEVLNSRLVGEAGGLVVSGEGSRYVKFHTNNAERMRINSSGNVGIGVVPESHYTGYVAIDFGKSGGLFSNASGTNLTNLSNNAYLNSDASAWIYKETDEASAYNQTAGTHRWSVASSGTAGTAITWSEAMRIDSAGNLLVATTSTSTQNLTSGGGTVISALGGVASAYQSVSASDPVVSLNNTGVDSSIIAFRKDGAAVGSIGVTNGNNLTVGGAVASHAGIQFGTGNVTPMVAGSEADAGADLGAFNLRWKDLYLSGGAYIGGVAAANKLDDYEEGTWTPNWTGLGNGTASGTYTKIGRLVHITAIITYGSTTNIGTKLEATNLPFSAQMITYGLSRMENFQSNSYIGAARASGAILRGYIINTAGSQATEVTVSTTQPFTWGENDYAQLSVTYYTN